MVIVSISFDIAKWITNRVPKLYFIHLGMEEEAKKLPT